MSAANKAIVARGFQAYWQKDKAIADELAQKQALSATNISIGAREMNPVRLMPKTGRSLRAVLPAMFIYSLVAALPMRMVLANQSTDTLTPSKNPLLHRSKQARSVSIAKPTTISVPTIAKYRWSGAV